MTNRSKPLSEFQVGDVAIVDGERYRVTDRLVWPDGTVDVALHGPDDSEEEGFSIAEQSD